MNKHSWTAMVQRIKHRETNQNTNSLPTRPVHRRRKVVWIPIGLVALLLIAVAASLARQGSLLSMTDLAANSKPGAGATTDMPAAYPTTAMATDAYSSNGSQPAAPPASGAGGARSSTSTAQQDTAVGAAGSTGGQSTSGTNDWDRMIIRTATLQLKVKDVNVALDEVRSLASGHAGYVSASDSHQDGDSTVATITLQVPASEFDNTMIALCKEGLKVLSENVSSSDVTEEYTDLNSQLRNLQATEQRILALTQKADQIADILSLDHELRDIQGQIEQIQGRLNYLSKRSEMSTITVSLFPNVVAAEPLVTETTPGWNPTQVASRAWNSSMDFLAGVGTAVITVVVYLWWALPLVLITALLVRRARRNPSTPIRPTPPIAPVATE